MATENPYGSMGSVPTVSATNAAAPELSVNATPLSMGAGIGASVEEAGKAGQDLAAHYLDFANKTAVNDTIVNGYVPQVNAVVADYKKLNGTDAVQQLPAYQQKLQSINDQYLNQGSMAQREMLGSFVTRHSIQTMSDMSNHADREYDTHANIVQAQTVKMYQDDAVNNVNDPKRVDESLEALAGQTKLHAGDKLGHTPDNDPFIQQMANDAKGAAAGDVIKAAFDSGQTELGMSYLTKYKDFIPATERLSILKTATSLNRSNNISSVVDSWAVGGDAIPKDSLHYADNQVKASVADLAKQNGWDSNIAFAVHGVESHFGKGINPDSARQDDFQTDKAYRDKGFEDDSLASSVHNGAKIWKESSATLTQNLGRSITPAEGYVGYNQGGAGAAALLNASPDTTAVAALSKIMPADQALDHVKQNGGSANVSAADFTANLKDKFQTVYDSQKITGIADPSKYIRDQANVTTPVAERAADAHDVYKELFNREPDMRANAIANYGGNELDLNKANALITLKLSQAKQASAAWDSQQNDVAKQYLDDPKYTTMDQIPPSVQENFKKVGSLTGQPEQFYHGLKKQFAEKVKVNADASNGTGFVNALSRVASNDPTDSINDNVGVTSLYGQSTDLHSAGVKNLITAVKTASTPEGKAQVASQAQFLEDLHYKMTGMQSGDPNAATTQGGKDFDKKISTFFSGYNKAQQDGKLDNYLSLDPNVKDSFVATNKIKLLAPAQITSQKINNSVSFLSSIFGGGKAPEINLNPREQIMADFMDKKITEQQKNAQLSALSGGVQPSVPRPD